MRIPAESEPCVRFGKFELDLLRVNSAPTVEGLSFRSNLFRFLSALLERPGHLVTRNELKRRLWSSDTFVDFERSLNKAVNRLREVLEDSADRPRFIETLPRQGYRFIATIEPSFHSAPRKREAIPGKRPAREECPIWRVRLEVCPLRF